MGGYHWYFLAQPRGFPERLIGADPEFFLRHMMGHASGPPDPTARPSRFSDDAFAEYLRCFRNPEVIHATCEDYRAGATIDFDLDAADLAAGRRIECPMLALWGERGSGVNPRPGSGGRPTCAATRSRAATSCPRRRRTRRWRS
jgi:haloacetate dehalogenase